MIGLHRSILAGILAVFTGSVFWVSTSVAALPTGDEFNLSETQVQGVRAESESSVTLTQRNGKYYVNNHEITFRFNYENSFYDKTAWFVTKFRINPTVDTTIVPNSAQLIDYRTEWGYAQSKDNVLSVYVKNLDGSVYRNSGGAYDGKYASYAVKDTTLVIDPDTGAVIDFPEDNYFYRYGSLRYTIFNKGLIECEGCEL